MLTKFLVVVSGLSDELTVELSLKEASDSVSGLAELLVAVYAMMLSDDAWSKLVKLSVIASLALSGRADPSDVPCMSFFVAIEVSLMRSAAARMCDQLVDVMCTCRPTNQGCVSTKRRSSVARFATPW